MIPNPDLPTVMEFCDHIGIEPLRSCLRAIDKYNMEAVDIMIEGTDEWLGPDDHVKLDSCSDYDTIEMFRVHGIAWDGSDWEWGEHVKGEDGFGELDRARAGYQEALAEHQAFIDEGGEA